MALRSFYPPYATTVLSPSHLGSPHDKVEIRNQATANAQLAENQEVGNKLHKPS